MVLGVTVNVPEIVKLGVGQNIFHAQRRRHHGVIPIIIFVHGVAPDKVQVRITRLQFLPDGGDMQRLIVVVNRVGFLVANYAAIHKIALPSQAELLADRERINLILQEIIDRQTDPSGIKVTAVEVKDVALLDTMKCAMAKQAEAERERRISRRRKNGAGRGDDEPATCGVTTALPADRARNLQRA